MSKSQSKPDKEFFDNVGFIRTLDTMAQRYGKAPTELLDTSIYDFCFNVAVMIKAVLIDSENVPAKLDKKSEFKGFDYKVG